jgi:uncharacterized lipoprotein YbaY
VATVAVRLMIFAAILAASFSGTAARSPRQIRSPNSGMQKHPPIRFAVYRRQYNCARGVTLATFFGTKEMRLVLGDHTYELKLLDPHGDSSAGAKYSDGKVVWTLDGPDAKNGSLADVSDPANPKMLATDCHLQTGFPPTPAAGSSFVEGTVSFPAHPKMPPDAVLTVELRDLTPKTGDVPELIGVQIITIQDQRPPMPFKVPFDPSKVSSNGCCQLEATLAIDGQVQFKTTTPYKVRDSAEASAIKLVLSPTNQK